MDAQPSETDTPTRSKAQLPPHPRSASSALLPGSRLAKTAMGAAATGALFALQHHADAAVIYTNLMPDTVRAVGPDGFTTAQFNLNGGPVDFGASLRHQVGPFSNTNSHTFSSGSVAFRALVVGNQVLQVGSGRVRKLASGAGISAGAAFGWGGGGVLRKASTVFGFFLGSAGSWLPGQVGFAGLRLDAGGGNYNYGWIRMQVDDVDGNTSPDKLTIFDYAYETNINTAIASGAGITAAVPEPSRALLALAGIGAAALRRRRPLKQAA